MEPVSALEESCKLTNPGPPPEAPPGYAGQLEPQMDGSGPLNRLCCR